MGLPFPILCLSLATGQQTPAGSALLWPEQGGNRGAGGGGAGLGGYGLVVSWAAAGQLLPASQGQ